MENPKLRQSIEKTVDRPPSWSPFEHMLCDEVESLYSDRQIAKAWSIFATTEAFAHLYGHVTLVGLSLREKDGHWLAVLNGRRKSQKLVGFIRGKSFREAIANAAMGYTNGYIQWRQDKYA